MIGWMLVAAAAAVVGTVPVVQKRPVSVHIVCVAVRTAAVVVVVVVVVVVHTGVGRAGSGVNHAVRRVE